ncbi:MAG: glycosyltransferase family 2 protein [Halobacteriales archaeon]
MDRRRWLDRAGFVGVSGSILATSVVQGLGVLSFRAEVFFVAVVVVLLHAVLSSLAFTAFIGLSGLLFAAKLLRDRRSPAVASGGGEVAAIVPVYRDGSALQRSVESLLASTYAELSVHVVCEPDDGPSRRRAEALAEDDRVEVLVNTSQRGTKAGAVNHAVETTDSEYVAVFDADERVDPRFVGHAVAGLDDHDVVQGRTVPEPAGVIEELAYYESVLLSYVARRPLYLVTGFRMASSRAVVMDRAAFERVGGYDPEMLTEDFEFAYRCYIEHLDVTETLAYPSRIEAAHTLADWWGQRKRWMTGYTQVVNRLVRDIDPRSYRSVLSVIICAGTVVGSALTLSVVSKFLVLLVIGAEAWFLPPVAAVLGVTLGVRLYDRSTCGIRRPTRHWLVVPLLFPLYGFTTVKAGLEYLLSWDGDWYRVEKS